MLIFLVLVSIALAVWLRERFRHRSPARDRRGPTLMAASGQAARSIGSRGDTRTIETNAPRRGDAIWVPRGAVTKLTNITIEGGMLYVGTSLRVTGGFRDENCLVNPNLPIRQIRLPTAPPGYWPSYSTITPEQRWSYLNWLRTGRSDPTVDVGYVVLFFYGLERRLYLDRAASELHELVSEVERLLVIYGGNRSFNSYASNFLSMAQIASGSITTPELQLPSYSPELPLATRVHIGRVLAARSPLDAKTALLWILGRPEVRVRTPGQRCFKELVALWNVRFAQRHPNGLAVRAPKRLLKFHYKAASGTFDVAVLSNLPPLPDVGAVTTPLQGLTDLLEACVSELEPYSRLLGKHPDARQTMEGVLLLPEPIRGGAGHAVIDAARTRLAGLVGPSDMATTTVSALCDALGLQQPLRSSKRAASQLAFALDRLDYALEPDMRYGATMLGGGGTVVVFKADGGAPVAPGRAEYEHARLAAEVGILAAAADGEVTREEMDALTDSARSNMSLQVHERLRLEALVRAMQASQPSLQVAMKRAVQLPAARRAEMLGHAAAAIMADGKADASEVRFLERLHKALGLQPAAAHSVLHQAATRGRDGPIRVAAAHIVAGATLPPDLSATAASKSSMVGMVGLDQLRLAHIRDETLAVSRLLSEVFSDDDSSMIGPSVVNSGPADMVPDGARQGVSPGPYNGLDAAHGMVLAKVARAGAMPSEDFERECRTRKLMPSAALEAINEWAFDHFDEPVVEEEDEVVRVPDYISAKLTAMLRTENG